MEKLKYLIKDKGLKKTWIAKQLGLSREGFAKKLSGEREFKASEICKLGELLSLSDKELTFIFFTNNDDLKSL